MSDLEKDHSIRIKKIMNAILKVYVRRGYQNNYHDSTALSSKVTEFARSMPGFDQESIDWYLSEADRIKKV